MNKDQNLAIAFIIPLIVQNNAGKVALALKDKGYSKNFIPEGELEARLFQLYITNPDMFFDVMKSIPWNQGEVETNKPEIKDKLMKLVKTNANYEVSKDTWWPQMIDLIKRSTIKEEKKACMNSGMGFLFLFAAIGIIAILYSIFK